MYRKLPGEVKGIGKISQGLAPEEQMDLHRAIAQLPEKYRDVVKLKYFDGCTIREHSFSFAADAEDNGAKVLAVSGTPVQTVITVEKPFWGLLDSIVETEAPTQGVACLELPDGTQLWMDLDRSRDLGGYDYTLQESQQADLYFDGLPGGVTQAVLRFYDANRGQQVLAEFTIDLSAQTVTS